MDEYNRGMEPGVRRYFLKIINSFSYGMIWLLSVVMAGLFYKLAFFPDGFRWQNAVFYLLTVVSFLLLLRYYIRVWGKKDQEL